jgi:uncharacterized protein (TIGR02147 family)
MKNHYRYFLTREFELRCQHNARYTLRAYANFINIDSGTLSQILKGKRKLAKSHWISAAKKLKLNNREKKIFLKSLWEEQGLDMKNNVISEKKAHLLSSEHYFEVITEWEYATALCLLDIKHHDFSVQNLTKYLGVSVKRANEVYGKLFQFGLIRNVEGKIEKIDQNFESTEDVKSLALETAHVNELKLSIEKVQSLNVLEREFTSLTFAGNAKDVKKMKLWIRSKRQEFEKIFESKRANQVFQFSVQLFPLTSEVLK